MAMEITKAGVEALVKQEKELANSKFPPFHSFHEGYAIIREEWSETQNEIYKMDNLVDTIEGLIFTNFDASPSVEMLETVAVNAACEAIQVAAMCQKYRDFRDKLDTPKAQALETDLIETIAATISSTLDALRNVGGS